MIQYDLLAPRCIWTVQFGKKRHIWHLQSSKYALLKHHEHYIKLLILIMATNRQIFPNPQAASSWFSGLQIFEMGSYHLDLTPGLEPLSSDNGILPPPPIHSIPHRYLVSTFQTSKQTVPSTWKHCPSLGTRASLSPPFYCWSQGCSNGRQKEQLIDCPSLAWDTQAE